MLPYPRGGGITINRHQEEVGDPVGLSSSVHERDNGKICGWITMKFSQSTTRLISENSVENRLTF